MKKVLIISRIDTSKLKKLLVENEFEIVRRNPDFIISYGGDGTILFSEREFPNIPKLVLKRFNICRKCDYIYSELNYLLPKIKDGKFEIINEIKLQTNIHKTRLIALNELQVRAKLPINALRFSISVNSQEYCDLIGDGIIVATPFGSTGYYKSTGGKKFTKGIGLSFNNLHNKQLNSFVSPEKSIIKTKIHRGPAWVVADNYERFFELKDDDISIIQKSENTARFIYVSR